MSLFGCHYNKTVAKPNIKKVNNLCELIDLTNANAFQIFISSPKSLANITLKQEYINNTFKLITEHNITLVIHAPYVINWCWSEDNNKQSYDKMMSIATEQIIYGSRLGAIGTVFHVGKSVKLDSDVANINMYNNIKTVIKTVNKSRSELPTHGYFILETAAGCGTELCVSIEELAEFYNKFSNRYKRHLKICVDTAHIWACGYNISTKEGIFEYIAQFNELIGWSNMVVIHLNDSIVECNSKKDRHGDLKTSMIWNNTNNGLETLIAIATITNKPIILETPLLKIHDFRDIDTIREISDDKSIYTEEIYNFCNILQ
jgi:deoxyribonuclease-4